MTKQEDISKKIMSLCLFLKKQKDPISGTIHLLENMQKIASRFELGTDATSRTLKVYYSNVKCNLTPKIAGFYPNHEVLEREYLYQNKLIVKRYLTKKKDE